MLLGHGLPKLRSFESSFHKFPDPIGLGSELSYLLAVFAEVLCSIALILGWYTRLAVIPLMILMVVVITTIHLDDPWNKKEFALMYLIPYLTIFFTGPGKFSLNRR